MISFPPIKQTPIILKEHRYLKFNSTIEFACALNAKIKNFIIDYIFSLMDGTSIHIINELEVLDWSQDDYRSLVRALITFGEEKAKIQKEWKILNSNYRELHNNLNLNESITKSLFEFDNLSDSAKIKFFKMYLKNLIDKEDLYSSERYYSFGNNLIDLTYYNPFPNFYLVPIKGSSTNCWNLIYFLYINEKEEVKIFFPKKNNVYDYLNRSNLMIRETDNLKDYEEHYNYLAIINNLGHREEKN